MPGLSSLATDYYSSQGRRDPNVHVKALDTFGEEQIAGLREYDGTFDAIINSSVQADRGEHAQRARDRAAAISDNIHGQLSRQQRALGLNLTDRQKKAQVRSLGLTRAISRASAVNSANRASADIAGDASRAGAGLSESFLDLSASGLTQLANAEGVRNQRIAQDKAQKRAQRNALLGNILGIATAFI